MADWWSKWPFSLKDAQKKEIDSLDQKVRNDRIRRMADRNLLCQSDEIWKKDKTFSEDDIYEVKGKLLSDTKAQSRIKAFNKYIEKQKQSGRIYTSMDQVRKELSPYYPKKFLDDQHTIDSLSLMNIQLDDILAFTSVPSPTIDDQQQQQ